MLNCLSSSWSACASQCPLTLTSHTQHSTRVLLLHGQHLRVTSASLCEKLLCAWSCIQGSPAAVLQRLWQTWTQEEYSNEAKEKGGSERPAGTGTARPGGRSISTFTAFLPGSPGSENHRDNVDVVSSFSLGSFPKESAWPWSLLI